MNYIIKALICIERFPVERIIFRLVIYSPGRIGIAISTVLYYYLICKIGFTNPANAANGENNA